MRAEFTCESYPEAEVRTAAGLACFHGGRFATDDQALADALADVCLRDTAFVRVALTAVAPASTPRRRDREAT